MSRSWRLLRDPAGSAARNMAVDEALLARCWEHGPALRLYTWRAPALSVGYRHAAPPGLARARRAGIERVRRVTGGGAVLHGADLTYAVVAPPGCAPLPDDLFGSYAWIREVLLEALGALGLDAGPAEGEADGARLSLCFAGATGLEIEVEGAKLVGSAQRRTRAGFLQHGSIRLRDDSALHATLFGRALPPPPASLRGLETDDVARALERAFAARLDNALVSASLSDAERQLALQGESLRATCDLARPPLVSRWAPPHADSFL